MKRRRFLSMLGAATAAPILPLPAAATAPAASYSPAALHAAILHAQASGHVSVQGLAGLLRIPHAKAETLMSDMMQRGMLAPMTGTNPPVGWARSRIYKPRFAMRVPIQRTELREPLEVKKRAHTEPSTPDALMAHLHTLCRRVGLSLHPSCATQRFA